MGDYYKKEINNNKINGECRRAEIVTLNSSRSLSDIVNTSASIADKLK